MAQQLRELMQKVRSVLADEKKKTNLLVCMGLAGVLLLALPEWMPKENSASDGQTETQTADEPGKYASQLQEQLQTLISQVDGAGNSKVMITFSSTEESVYATDSETSQDGATSINHVLLEDGGLIETVRMPQIQGVAVVCEGGESAAVQNQIVELLEALTGVGASHITVAKMAAAE